MHVDNFYHSLHSKDLQNISVLYNNFNFRAILICVYREPSGHKEYFTIVVKHGGPLITDGDTHLDN